MEQYLESNLKDLLQGHPALGAVLDAAGIGCSTCSLGTCRTKDILEIHNLDGEATRALLTRMGEVLYAGRPFQVPMLERKAAPVKGAFCPPIARMVHEHTYILRLIALIPDLCADLADAPQAALAGFGPVLEFIRTYADGYHHAKEENILFGYFDPESAILQAMLQDHGHGREHVAEMAAGVEQGDPDRVIRHLRAYGELLRGHIQREDSILYPWMDRTLSTRQVGELFARCAEVDGAFGDRPRSQESFVLELEKRFR